MYSIFVGTRTNRGNRRYWYNRMPFGIASGPEEYQRREHEFLDGLRGVINIADDICMYGCGNTKKDADIDHDRNLVQLLEKCAEHDRRLSAKNLQFKSPSVTFMGQKLTHKGAEPGHQKNASSNWQSFSASLPGSVPLPVHILRQPVRNSLAIEEPCQRWLCSSLIWKSRNSI